VEDRDEDEDEEGYYDEGVEEEKAKESPVSMELQQRTPQSRPVNGPTVAAGGGGGLLAGFEPAAVLVPLSSGAAWPAARRPRVKSPTSSTLTEIESRAKSTKVTSKKSTNDWRSSSLKCLEQKNLCATTTRSSATTLILFSRNR
jgi:hypothetical protein